jgi:hypothetical protein
VAGEDGEGTNSVVGADHGPALLLAVLCLLALGRVVGLSFDFSAPGTSTHEGKVGVHDLRLMVEWCGEPTALASQGGPAREEGGGICPCSGLALPLAGLGLVLWQRGRSRCAAGL